MNTLTAFEALSDIPFLAEATKKEFAQILPNTLSRENFLAGDQLNLRKNLSLHKRAIFADAIDIVAL